jgi:hypothetical protein
MDESVEKMSFEDWRNRKGRFGTRTFEDMTRDPSNEWAIQTKLREAVAYYLYIESKDVPDDKAALYRAAALALLNKPVDPALMVLASKRKSNDDPLYDTHYGTNPDLFDLWQYHHRVEIDAAERR